MATPLIFGDEQKADLARLRQYAEAHPFTYDDLLDRKNGQAPVPGTLPEFRCDIPVGFKVVLTIEDHPGGKMRVFSMSSAARGRIPHPAAVELIMGHLGFTGTLRDPSVRFRQDDEVVYLYQKINT